MATTTVDVLIDDLDGSPAVETIRLGWNGEWRELDLSKRNVASLARTFDKYWHVGRPVAPSTRNRRRRPTRSAAPKATRDPKVIRAWAAENGITVPARGRIPRAVEDQYNQARRSS
jgi:hypothetical protein